MRFVVAATVTPYIEAAVYFIATVVGAKLVSWLMQRREQSLLKLIRRPSTANELSRMRVARHLVVAIILFVGFDLVLIEIPQVGSLARGMMASAGITALVVGIAARSVIANFVSGVVLTFARPLRIGDIVTVDDATGSVEDISLLYCSLLTPDNRRVLIPNDLLTSKVIHNHSLVDEVSSATVDFEVPASASLETVRALAVDEVAKLGQTPPGREPTLDVTEITISVLRLRLTVWAASKPLAVAQADAVRAAVLARLQEQGVIGSSTPA